MSCKGINLREKNPRWKGGEFVASGYMFLLKPGHPNSRPNGYIKRCRFVMSEHIGRPLLTTELVHHTNGNKSDDSLENLVIISRGDHAKEHTTGSKNGRYSKFRTKTCPNCGKEFHRGKNDSTFMKKKRCSIKCRNEYYRGERGDNTKITQEIANKIKGLKGILSSRKIAVAFGLSPTHTKRILRGETW